MQNNRYHLITCLLLLSFFYLFSSCRKNEFDVQATASKNDSQTQKRKTNIILILGDDVGYEVLTCNGGQSYKTPFLDNLAAQGIRFTQCQACPNCCPSRIELLTGKYGFRNYTEWGALDTAQKTIANMLKDAGYKTCVAGKWQLGGGDTSVKKFGFDKYLLFYPFDLPDEGKEDKYRYKNPKLYENGAYLPDSVTNGQYADDMFVDYISDFIDSNVNNPFFIYYPLSLCHKPFSPTPDDPQYANWNPLQNKSDSSFYPSMVKYMDKEIKKVKDKVAAAGLKEQTIIIYMGDNGTPPHVYSEFDGRIVQGGKSTSTTYGTHVPLIAYWPGSIIPGQVSNGLIDFSDFLPTLAKIAKTKKPQTYGPLDGINFYPLLFGSTDRLRDWSYCYWHPENQNDSFRIWVQDENYKLYDNTNQNYFFDITNDLYELNPIAPNKLDTIEQARKHLFKSVLNSMHN